MNPQYTQCPAARRVCSSTYMEALPTDILRHLVKVATDSLLDEELWGRDVAGPLPKALHDLREEVHRATLFRETVALRRFELDCRWAAINSLACVSKTFARAWREQRDSHLSAEKYCDFCRQEVGMEFIMEKATEYNAVFKTCCFRIVYNGCITDYTHGFVCEDCQLESDLAAVSS